MVRYENVREESALLRVPKVAVVTKKTPLFYNPVMKLNRDITILLLRSLNRSDLQIALPLVGSGVRAIRILKEVPKSIVRSVACNDKFQSVVTKLKNHLNLNNITARVTVAKEDASEFLLNGKGFDYIDIDPFGSPNHFLDAAIKRLSRDGVLGVTATDTAALCGTYPSACKRKYWAVPLNNECKHEAGLRILIRKVQLIGFQFDKALMPILSYSKDHYFRIFFQCNKSKPAVDLLNKEQEFVSWDQKTGKRNMISLGSLSRKGKKCIDEPLYGPLYVGSLHKSSLLKQMLSEKNTFGHEKFLNLLYEESQIHEPFLFDLHTLASTFSLPYPPKLDLVLSVLNSKGYIAKKTHFLPTGFHSNAPLSEIKRAMKKVNK